MNPRQPVIDPALLAFLELQQLLVLAAHDGQDVWIANVYYGVDKHLNFYFVSPESTQHSQLILKSPRVAFSVAWFDRTNHANRKAVQGRGKCRIAASEAEIVTGIELHNRRFPEFRERITVDWIRQNEWNSRVWVLEPEYMKFWNDEQYADEEFREFHFA